MEPQCPACDCRDSLRIEREGRDENAHSAIAECSGCNAIVIIDRRLGTVRQVKRDPG